jgi:hypothetical protein
MESELELVSRADFLRNQLSILKHNLVSGYLETGRVLREIRDNNFYQDYGYSTFSQYVKEGADIDMGERSAYYAISVVEFAEKNGISDEVLQTVGISKLKSIASLPETTDGTTIMELVDKAKTEPLSSINDVCSSIRDTDHVVRSIRIDRDFYEMTYLDAIELVRKQHGSTIDNEGNVVDISESRAVELIVVDWFVSQIPDEGPKDEAAALRREVFERDEWKCRVSGSRNNLQAHHIVYRSQGGEDTRNNLVTLSNDVHEKIHAGRLKLGQAGKFRDPQGRIDADFPITYEEVEL